MLHHFSTPIADIDLPASFTYPFCYAPHPLCIAAANEVQHYLSEQTQWQAELEAGKMFGVLVVKTPDGTVGYLAAFSGILAGSNRHPFFVPPVYDLLQPQGFFKIEEEQISNINRRIKEMEADAAYLQEQQELSALQTEACQALQAAKEEMKQAKARRDAKRKQGGLSAQEEVDLVKESQHQKAEYKRMEQSYRQHLAAIEQPLVQKKSAIALLKQERKQRSAALQQQLFRQFVMLNARGESRDLCAIFADTAQRTPPAGAGECAAPKLLQQAYLHGWHPIAMAEFWWGASPKAEIRHHGHYYPACKGKCFPILSYMLQGLQVEPNPMDTTARQAARQQPEILYEDDWIAVVNKPAGMLSAPGKSDAPSVYSLMRERYPEADGPLIVHRLDMATSGLLLIAKTKSVHQALQKMFESRQIEKRYIALLHGQIAALQGTIALPLCPNHNDSPRQMVSREFGKPAVTRYEVLGVTAEGYTRVAFYPLTGRTHQLRMHAAHPEGLHCPIVGDELYGKKNSRLYLHAESLTFVHPVSGQRIEIKNAADF